MPLAIPIPLALGRFKRLPQRSGEVWQGGIVSLPMWVDNQTDANAPPFRPTGVVWVSLRTGLVHMDLPKEGEAVTPELALAVFLEFGLKWAKGLEGRPARIELRDAGLRDALAEPLAALDTSIALVDDLPAVREALINLEEHSSGEPLPGVLASPGMSVARLRAFASAAAAFFVAQPWNHLTNEDLLIVDSARAPRNMRHVSVLGHGGQEFGLGFFDSRAAFKRVLDLTDAGRPPAQARGVIFGTIDELPFADVDAWTDHALPVAGPHAYPLPADLKRDGSMRRPDARSLTYEEALLRALGETTEDELDAGTWQKHIDTFDGPIDLTFSLPFLLEAEAGRRAGPVPLTAMPRVAERQSVRIARLLEGRSFGTVEAMNAELEQLTRDGRAHDSPARGLTVLERAQELAYDAMEAQGRLRIKRARQALALSADCADAWVLLAEAAPTPEAAVELYERAVHAGAAAIGDDRFTSLRGEFWGQLDTRPYMRARLGLARALDEQGRQDEALAHYRALLELNPGDNQGVRYLLLVTLLHRGLNHEAGALLSERDDDIQALWPYGRLLWRFRVGGASPATRAAFDAAMRANPYVLPYLLEPDSIPADHAPHFALHSREEAAYVADVLGDAFATTDGALEWLAAQPRRGSPRSGRGRRGRQGPPKGASRKL
jgi:tetratricopeptide (TPR) repeat protein